MLVDNAMTDLPDLLHFSGDWHQYVDRLYTVYLNEIVNSGLTFKGLPVKSQYRPPSQGKGFGFWHVISDGNSEEDRIPDFRRCERVGWIAWIIKNAERDSRIRWWENRRGRNIHVVIWIENEEFVVVLAKRKDYYLLKTAYCPEPHRSRTFRKEWKKFQKSRNG